MLKRLPFAWMLGGCLVSLGVGCGRPTVPVALEPIPVESIPTAVLEIKAAPPQPAEAASDGFQFPSDRGGKLLADLLPPQPRQSRLPSDPPTERVRFSIPRGLVPSELALPANVAEPPLIAPVRRRPAQPAPLGEGLPLVEVSSDPRVPARAELPAGERVREWSPKVEEPSALPILAQKQGEPANSDDLTSEVSLAAALAAAPPRRETPAPLLHLTLPDPFEFRHSARLQTELPESTTPVSGPVRPPGS
jgi:hypothetical protein